MIIRRKRGCFLSCNLSEPKQNKTKIWCNCQNKTKNRRPTLCFFPRNIIQQKKGRKYPNFSFSSKNENSNSKTSSQSESCHTNGTSQTLSLLLSFTHLILPSLRLVSSKFRRHSQSPPFGEDRPLLHSQQCQTARWNIVPLGLRWAFLRLLSDPLPALSLSPAPPPSTFIFSAHLTRTLSD